MSETQAVRVNPAIRGTTSTTTTTVRLVAQPFGRGRENPPSLQDLRDFVERCEGLPDSIPVRIEPGSLDEGGRRHVVFSLAYRHPDEVSR